MFLYPTFIRSISSALGGELFAAKAGEVLMEEVVNVTRAVDPARMKRSRRDACMAVDDDVVVEEDETKLFLFTTCGANA